MLDTNKNDNYLYLLTLKKKLEKLTDEELYNYVFDNYNQKQLCCKRSLLIRYIINIERNKINELNYISKQ